MIEHETNLYFIEYQPFSFLLQHNIPSEARSILGSGEFVWLLCEFLKHHARLNTVTQASSSAPRMSLKVTYLHKDGSYDATHHHFGCFSVYGGKEGKFRLFCTPLNKIQCHCIYSTRENWHFGASLT